MTGAAVPNGNGRSSQWAIGIIVSVAIFVVSSFGVAGYLLVGAQINAVLQTALDNKAAAEKLSDLLRDDYIPRTELNGWRVDDQARLERLSQSMSQLRSDSITHSEHQALIDRISSLEKAFGATYSIGDVLKNLQDRLQRIEDRTAPRSGAP